MEYPEVCEYPDSSKYMVTGFAPDDFHSDRPRRRQPRLLGWRSLSTIHGGTIQSGMSHSSTIDGRMFRQDPHRQSRRNRMPGDPHLPAAGHPHRRGVFRRRCRCAARAGWPTSTQHRRGAAWKAICKMSWKWRRPPAHQAIHPGYASSRAADFADAVEAAGIVFIGPKAASMRKMGNKAGAGTDAGGRAGGSGLHRRGSIAGAAASRSRRRSGR